MQLRLLCGKSNPPQPPFTFRAGQWVDFYIQGLQRCGGYSMVSGPETLPQLTLAVKESALSEPAQWVHREARPMDHVAMRVGGSFFFEVRCLVLGQQRGRASIRLRDRQPHHPSNNKIPPP